MSESDAEFQVRRWLERGGLSLELRTQSAFRSVNAQTRHSTYYTDVTTEKPREVDVIASLQEHQMRNLWVHYVIECKAGTAAVWVLYKSTTQRASSRDLLATLPKYADPGGNWIGGGKHTASAIRTAAYQVGDTKDSNRSYSAVTAAISAASGLWRLRQSQITVAKNLSGGPEAHVWIPVVVTSADVCIIDVDQDPPELTTTQEPQLLTLRLGMDASESSVWIVPEPGLAQFVSEARDEADSLSWYS